MEKTTSKVRDLKNEIEEQRMRIEDLEVENKELAELLAREKVKSNRLAKKLGEKDSGLS